MLIEKMNFSICRNKKKKWVSQPLMFISLKIGQEELLFDRKKINMNLSTGSVCFHPKKWAGTSFQMLVPFANRSVTFIMLLFKFLHIFSWSKNSVRISQSVKSNLLLKILTVYIRFLNRRILTPRLLKNILTNYKLVLKCSIFFNPICQRLFLCRQLTPNWCIAIVKNK